MAVDIKKTIGNWRSKYGTKIAGACKKKIGKRKTLTVDGMVSILGNVLDEKHRKTYVPPSGDGLVIGLYTRHVHGTFDFRKRQRP